MTVMEQDKGGSFVQTKRDVQFHLVQLVHELLFHFVFLLTVLSVVFVAFCSLYHRNRKVFRTIEKIFSLGRA